MKAFWWRGTEYPNLGDELGEIILNRMFGQEVQHSPLAVADIVTVGSSLGWAVKWERSNKASTHLHVVGSGFMSPDIEIKPTPHLKIHSVRGYLSKNRLGSFNKPSISVGDPGLLVSRVANSSAPPITPTSKYGVILHHSKTDNEAVRQKFDHLPVKFLDIRTNDLDHFVAEMQSCDVIIGQSLHALVIADSLGIPNIWVDMGALHPGASFKFYDYFSSIGREFYLRLTDVPKSQKDLDAAIYESRRMRIYELQEDIQQAHSVAISSIANA